MRRTLAFVLTALISTSAVAFAGTTLVETGSTLLYPLMQHWVADYQRARADVQISTQGTGSAMGISQAMAGVAQIGASDAYVDDAAMRSNPMLNIPLAISAQQVNYNIPGLNEKHLNLSGAVLASIYSGQIAYWDDARIKADNKRLKLPHEKIVTIHRAEGSGDTFIFTQFLAKSAPAWQSGPGFATTINWPSLDGSIAAARNSGMIDSCEKTPYSIAYVGIAYLDQATRAGLGTAALENADGKFVLPAERNIAAAANTLDPKTPSDERISLVLAPGAASYPLVNYEYAIVNPKQMDRTIASELKKFLEWTVGQGQNAKYLKPVHFLPLPSAVVKLSRAQIAKIQ